MNKDCLLIIAQQAHMMWWEEHEANKKSITIKLYADLYNENFPEVNDQYFLDDIRNEGYRLCLNCDHDSCDYYLQDYYEHEHDTSDYIYNF